MKTRLALVSGFILIGLLLSVSQALAEPPPLPSSFYGTVKVDGKNLPAGTIISAWIDGVSFGVPAVVQTYQGDTVYSLDVPGDEKDTTLIEGGVAGDVIQFRIGDQLAAQHGAWQSGTNAPLDLSYSTANDQQYLFLPLITKK
jgi:hypothetical protein